MTQLRKVYGNNVAVDGVSFAVQPKEIVGLLGPNGAGKTTIINTIWGPRAECRSVWIEGIGLASHRSQALARTNFAAVYAPLPGNLTVYQNLRVFGLIYGVRNLRERIAVVLKQFDLESIRNLKCGVLSSGDRPGRRLQKPC